MKEKNKSKMLNKTASNVQDVLFQKPKLSISMNWDATNTARFMMNYWELVRLQVFGVKGSQTYAMWTLPDSSFSLTLYILYFTREEKISWFFCLFFFFTDLFFSSMMMIHNVVSNINVLYNIWKILTRKLRGD